MFLALGTVIFLFGTLTFALEPPFIVILITRFLLGFGIAMIETGLNAFIVEFRSTPLMSSLHAFFGAGSLIGPLIAAALLTRWSWNSVYVVLSLTCLPLLFGFLTFFVPQSATLVTIDSEVEAKAETMQARQSRPTENALVTALKTPIVWLASLFLLFYVGVEVSLGNWSYTFLTEGPHLTALFSSLIVSGFWLGLTMGRFVLSAISERFGLSAVGLIYLCIAGVLLGSLLLWFVSVTALVVVCFCFVGLCLGPIYPTTIALVPKIVPDRLGNRCR